MDEGLVQKVLAALDAELGRQAAETNNSPYVGELWEDGEIVLDGTFDLNAIAIAAIRAATGAGQIAENANCSGDAS